MYASAQIPTRPSTPLLESVNIKIVTFRRTAIALVYAKWSTTDIAMSSSARKRVNARVSLEYVWNIWKNGFLNEYYYINWE